MKIFLRILIVLILLLAGAALFLSLKLFDQREELRGRAAMHEEMWVEVAKYVEDLPEQTPPNFDLAETDHMTLTLKNNELKKYYRTDSDGIVTDANGKRVIDGTGTLNEKLTFVKGRAEAQLMRLNSTRTELDATRNTLASTERQLDRTEGDLRESRSTIVDREGQIEGLVGQVAEKDVEIEMLEEEKSQLNVQIENQVDEIAKLQDRQGELESDLKSEEMKTSRLQETIRQLRNKDGEGPVDGAAGQYGMIVAVNPDWNFVVIKTRENSTLTPGQTLLIQRGRDFVGKVRINDVKPDENLAIADILNKWQQLPIQKGDNVIL